MRNKDFDVKFDTRFEEVIAECSTIKRTEGSGTWITEEMKEAYIHLHHLGFAHSVETYIQGKLAGGLYGVSLGRVFYGESMFFKVRDASKISLVMLARKLTQWGFHLIDAQVETSHILRMGGIRVPRKDFLIKLKDALNYPNITGKW